MRSFKDSKGDIWDVAIHITAERRLRSRLNFSLIDLAKDKFIGLADFLGDPIRLVDVLYVICEDQCRERGISDEDFGRRMFGDTITKATQAFLEELTDFFPEPEVRAALDLILKTGRKVAQGILANSLKQLQAMDLESLAKSSIEQHLNSQESAELTPDLTPSPN